MSEPDELRAENTRLVWKLRTLAGSYVQPCTGCDAPTWWRTGLRVPICLKCAMRTGRDATNAVPPPLREFLPQAAPKAVLEGEK